MNIVDIRTVILLSAITYILCTLFIVQLWRQNRERFGGMHLWVVHFVLQTVALVLIALRGAIPDWLSIIVSNTLAIMGAVFLYAGLERFFGKKGAQIQNYILLALCAAAFAYWTFVRPDLPLRTLIVSVGILIIVTQCLWLLWCRIDPALRQLTSSAGVAFGGYFAVSIIRIIQYFSTLHEERKDFFSPGTFQGMMLLSYMMLLILLTYGLVLMVNRRLIMEIANQEKKFLKAFNSAPYAITITRVSDGTIVDVNKTFMALTGYDREEVIGKRTLNLQLWENVKDRDSVFETLSKSGKVADREFRFRKKFGEAATGLFSAEIIHINGEEHLLSSIWDITGRKLIEESLKESEQRYRELSIIDNLTNLYNSRHFYNQLKVEIDRSNRYKQPLSLLLLDIDNFKFFNDTYGHVEGDQVISRLGQVMKGSLRDIDSGYRYGGEEFTVMLPVTTKEAGTIIAERIRKEFKKEVFYPVTGQDQDVHMTVSIGIAQYKEQEDIKSFVSRADEFMYQAKRKGRDRVCCEP